MSSKILCGIFSRPDAVISTENPRGYVLEIYNFGISMGQLLSVPMILIGVLLILQFLV